ALGVGPDGTTACPPFYSGVRGRLRCAPRSQPPAPPAAARPAPPPGPAAPPPRRAGFRRAPPRKPGRRPVGRCTVSAPELTPLVGPTSHAAQQGFRRETPGRRTPG